MIKGSQEREAVARLRFDTTGNKPKVPRLDIDRRVRRRDLSHFASVNHTMINSYRFNWTLTLFWLLTMAGTGWASAGIPPLGSLPRAIYTDPPHDARYPARTALLHIPTGKVKINGIAYLAEGPGLHPTAVLLLGLPGDEKDLDLAQAVRRAGWNAIDFFYRGSWGSPGVYRISHCLQDARAVLVYLRAEANAKALGIDTARIVLLGHSMGGWIAVETAAHDHHLAGVALISAADMGVVGAIARARLMKLLPDSMEPLAGVTPELMADELETHARQWRFDRVYKQIDRMPLLVITADDAVRSEGNMLVTAVRARGNRSVTAEHIATDHVYSDRRIALESAVIEWLQSLPR